MSAEILPEKNRLYRELLGMTICKGMLNNFEKKDADPLEPKMPIRILQEINSLIDLPQEETRTIINEIARFPLELQKIKNSLRKIQDLYEETTKEISRIAQELLPEGPLVQRINILKERIAKCSEKKSLNEQLKISCLADRNAAVMKLRTAKNHSKMRQKEIKRVKEQELSQLNGTIQALENEIAGAEKELCALDLSKTMLLNSFTSSKGRIDFLTAKISELEALIQSLHVRQDEIQQYLYKNLKLPEGFSQSAHNDDQLKDLLERIQSLPEPPQE